MLIGISATGTVEPVEVIDVGAQIVGRIKSFGPDSDSKNETIDYGSLVKKGDVLAKLDDLPYNATPVRITLDEVDNISAFVDTLKNN